MAALHRSTQGSSTRGRRLRALVAGVLLVGLSWAAFDQFIKPNVFPKRFGVVVEGKIYRSGRLTPAAMKSVQERYGIRTIVDLGAEIDQPPENEERARRTAAALGMTRYRLNLIGDATGNPNYYVQALRLMSDPANQPVLVHCGAGTQRTGCAVILYRDLFEGRPIEQSVEEAERFDYDERDNPKMLEMARRWRDGVAQALQTGASVAGAAAVPSILPDRASH